MKYFLTISLIITLQIDTIAQFTILCGRNITSARTHFKLKALDQVGKGETLKIDSAGYLLLADSNWNLFEFRGKREVTTDSLQGFLIMRSAAPNYSILFSTEPLRLAIVDYRICNEFVHSSFPYSRSFEITQPLYLWSDCSTCKVCVVNEFDEKVSPIELTLGRWTEFDLTNLFNKRRKKLFIRINQNCSQVPDYYVFGPSIAKFNNINNDWNRASTKLLMALYFEQIGYFKKALDIYLEALNTNSLDKELENLINKSIARVRKN